MTERFEERMREHNATLAARRQNIAAGLQGLLEGDDFELEAGGMEDDFWANIDISKMSRIELKVALEARGLATDGGKRELRKRLELSVQDEKEEELEYLAMVEAARRAEAALEEAGSVYTVGANRRGQLGLGHTEDMFDFTVIKKLRGKGIVEVCAGADIALARAEDGNVYSWGGLGEGPLGIGARHGDGLSSNASTSTGAASRKQPHGHNSGASSTKRSARGAGSVALTTSTSSTTHALGHRAQFLVPQLVETLQGEGIVSICCGANHAGALSDGGDCYTWGDGTRGQLGTGKLEVAAKPVLVDEFRSGTMVAQLAVGQTHTLAVLSDKSLWSWGFANSGKLGLGVTERHGVKPPLNGYFPEPCLVASLSNKPVHKIACSANHCAAVTDEGLFTWGSGDGGRLGHGDNNDRLVPTLVADLVGSTIIDVSLGFWHSAAVVQIPPVQFGGWLFTWGSGYHGQLAHDRLNNTNRPKYSQVFLDMHLHLVKVSCGPTHCYAMNTDGDLFSWGSCANGELARADINENENFTPVPGIVEGFNTMVGRVGRGTVVSFDCGNQFTVVATAKYMGPSEEEIQQIEEEEAIAQAEEEHRRREEAREKKRKEKAALVEQKREEMARMNESKPLCDMCTKCPGFEANVFKPNVCKECGHQRARHTVERKDEDEEEQVDPDVAARKR